MKNKIKHIITRWCEVARAGKEARFKAEIESRFSVRESGGKVFILCGGTAVRTLLPGETVADAVALIDEARKSALLYSSETSNVLKYMAR